METSCDIKIVVRQNTKGRDFSCGDDPGGEGDRESVNVYTRDILHLVKVSEEPGKAEGSGIVQDYPVYSDNITRCGKTG
jgi:hypothetical protein